MHIILQSIRITPFHLIFSKKGIIKAERPDQDETIITSSIYFSKKIFFVFNCFIGNSLSLGRIHIREYLNILKTHAF